MVNPDEEEVLENEAINLDARVLFSTKSADTAANNGSRGKLNEDQLDERAILHAKQQATGIPSTAEITKLWFDKYQITMTVQSENEWSRNNQARIDMAAARLEEDGDMPLVVVAPATIASMLGKAGRDVVETIRINKRAQRMLSGSLEEFTDPYKQIGCQNKETYWSSKGDQRVEFDRRLDHSIKLNKANTDAYKAITNSTVEQGKLLVDMMKVVSELNASAQTMDKAIEKKLRDEIKALGLKQQGKKDLEAEDVLAPVSDEERGL